MTSLTEVKRSLTNSMSRVVTMPRRRPPSLPVSVMHTERWPCSQGDARHGDNRAAGARHVRWLLRARVRHLGGLERVQILEHRVGAHDGGCVDATLLVRLDPAHPGSLVLHRRVVVQEAHPAERRHRNRHLKGQKRRR